MDDVSPAELEGAVRDRITAAKNSHRDDDVQERSLQALLLSLDWRR